ncbi:aminodeoxychorismate synthase component I [Devosia sp. MC521]|uniref:aminodeoxychorismate synthase component I n=1 Tax=Devosia sp. MC521 TaxID=2759954 RepID=UPI0015FC41FE|nr:aminodeoxychorismate synthase component I [Devosia sp. MC521]MBJ6988542.1 aminodeoxychorismate synthase component I [Devosia sp. MC521]QMW62652.1 aminodeoxychorismate synthase component I [Devosia sp. MC521]
MISKGTVLLQDSAHADSKSLLFSAPYRVLSAHSYDQALLVMAEMVELQAQGLWLAGYFAYEMGYGFEERLRGFLPAHSASPLLWFGVYDAPKYLTQESVNALLSAAPVGAAERLAPRTDFQTYKSAFDRVKNYIEAGDVYQINLTLKAEFDLVGDSLGFYRSLVQSQPTAFGAYIDAGDHKILSASPELFISAKDGALSARPMKGTLKRSPRAADDAAYRARLQSDEKNRAENLMIVDLLRNDMARISEIGSVRVTDLFTVETYRTLHTMTSGIVSRLLPEMTAIGAVENLFPCGSITGAPKLRAMEIIHEVEDGARGVYTGSIGFIAPNGDFSFNVAIRTAVIDAAGKGEIGVGGGIVADSVAEDEYQEALLKLQFLADPAQPVTLIETFKWSAEEGFVLRQRHVERLLASAEYFGLPVEADAIETFLDDNASAWTQPMRVRLTHSAAGLDLTAVVLPPSPSLFRFDIASEVLQSSSVWVAHKTTNRSFYDEPKKRAHDERGLDELVFTNERGELTEGSFTNLFIERDGRLLTPAVSSGLLPGTLRAEVLASGKAEEAILTLADLETADAIYLGNSVRGLIRAEWVRGKA